MMKQIAKAIPTCARALERFSSVVMSERIALVILQWKICRYLEGDAHCELHVSFAQTAYDARQHICSKGGALHPASSAVSMITQYKL